MVEFINKTQQKLPKDHLKQSVSFFTNFLLKKGELNKTDAKKQLYLIFVDKTEAKSLNLRFRKKKYATDILSFTPVESDSLGELVLCVELVKAQANQHQLSFRDECTYLVFHGILHLLGFEHELKDQRAEKMFALQDEAFESFLQRASKK